MVGSGSFCGHWGVFALAMDFKEVMLTSPSELAHCAPSPGFRAKFLQIVRGGEGGGGGPEGLN